MILLVAASATTAYLYDRSAATTVSVAEVSTDVSLPRSGAHVVVIIDGVTPKASGGAVEYLKHEVESRGMGTVILPAPSAGNSIPDMVNETVSGLRKNGATADHAVTILAVGHGAKGVWKTLADPPRGLVAAVTINVPGVSGLDFTDGTAVATLSLNLESDGLATSSHDEVHEAMSAAETLHQVIVYGGTESDALYQGDVDWNKPTADDVASRASDWLQHRDGLTNSNMENPGDGH